MIEIINSIPVSVMLFLNAIIVSLIGVWFSRKKVGAEVADKITLAAGRNIDEYEKRIARLESNMTGLQLKNGKLSQRITSVEHDARIYSEALHELETQHEALQARMKKWNEGIQILISQIEDRHGSRPDWRPDGE